MILPLNILPKVLGGALAGALIFSGVQSFRLNRSEAALGSAKEVIQRLTVWRGEMVTTVALASGSVVTVDTAKAQVQAMGSSLATLNGALKMSNDAVDRLADQKREAELRVASEMKARAAAIAKAQDLARQLRLSAVRPVEPEQMEAEIRRAQDLAYEAGQ